MSERAMMLLVWFYFMFLSGSEYDMNGSILEKIANVFRIIGTIAGAIWSVTCVVKELVSIPWGEWAENGVLEHIRELARGIMLFPFCVLLIWILHSLSMFMLHKIWPDSYDERGHMKDSGTHQTS